MSRREHFRDAALGTALRELEVPEHRPGFERELELLRGAGRRRDWRLPLGVAGGLALAAAAAVVLLLVLPGSRSGEALAAQIRASVAARLAHARTIQGTIVYRAVDGRTHRPVTTRARFAMDERGDLRIDGLGSPEHAVYDAATGIERGVGRSAAFGGGGPAFAFERTGIAPGAPDASPSEELFLQRRLGSALRALLVSGGAARARETTYLGRPAWQVVLPVRANRLFADEDRVALTIDRGTGFPLRVRTTRRGAFRSELDVRDLRLDEPLPPGDFTLALPRATRVARSDGGFRRVSLDEAERQVGYAPLVPDALPRGYRLTETAVARRGRIVSLSYRRGFDQLVVTTRPRPPAGRGDPFAEAGLPTRARSSVVDAGALRGATAHVVVDARSIPHLWADGPLRVTVAGDANEFELVQVARSLRAHGAAAAACRASDLRASAGLQGGAGALVGTLELENAGPRGCTVAGRPRITILAGGRPLAVHEVPVAPSWDGQLVPRGYPRLVVAPRGRVESRLAWSNWCGRSTGPLTLSFTLPRLRGRLAAPLEAATPRCDESASPSTIRVEPLIPVF